MTMAFPFFNAFSAVPRCFFLFFNVTYDYSVSFSLWVEGGGQAIDYGGRRAFSLW